MKNLTPKLCLRTLHHKQLLIPFLLFLLFLHLGAVFSDQELRIGPDREHLRPVKYAELEIDGRIPERIPEIYVLRPDITTLGDIVGTLDMARRDDSVEGVIVTLGQFRGGWAKANEIRSALQKVSCEGKEVIVYLEKGGNLQYFIASAADRIIMPRVGSLMLLGLRGEVVFLKGLFDKIGIEPDFVQIGAYKGASDPFTDKEASEDFDQSMNSLFDSLYAQLVDTISRGRGLEVDDVKNIIDKGPYTATRALDKGLIDEVAFYDQVLRQIEQREDAPFELLTEYGKEEVTSIPLGEGTQRLLKMLLGMRADLDFDTSLPDENIIAVVYAIGSVVMRRPESLMIDESVVDARLLVSLFKKLKSEDKVKAIVLRIESPGGDAQASDMIWQAIRQTDRVKPVITSISDVAGSGGYYIASGGRYLMASRGSLTGSIGVVGGKFVINNLFEKLGLDVEVYQRGEHAGLFSSVDKFSESQKTRFTEMLEDTYDIFLERVADARGLSSEELNAAAAGRPFTGAQALGVGLIDEIGGLQDAIDHALNIVDIDRKDAEVLSFPKSQSLLDAIFWGRDIGVNYPPALLRQRELEGLLPPAAHEGIRYLNAVSMLRDYQPAALMPAVIRIR